MSQEKLADLLGVTFQQVQKYEKGVNRIAASRLFDIAMALSMPIHAFFEGHAQGDRASVNDDVIHKTLATAEGMELLRLFASVREIKVRRRIVELVKAMQEE